VNRIKTAALIDKIEFHIGEASTGVRNDGRAAVIRVAIDVEACRPCLPVAEPVLVIVTLSAHAAPSYI
jgi:hypothetical protein